MNEYTVVFAPAGVKLGDAIGKLSHEEDVVTQDIEDKMKGDPNVDKALQSIHANYGYPVNMETITLHLPRLQVAKFWREAVKRCLDFLRKSDLPLRLLAGHLLYYGAKRNEFYSVVDASELCLTVDGSTKLKPTRIVLLVDDIYDMYTRLSQQGQLFAPNQIWGYFKKIEKTGGVSVSAMSKDRLSFLTMGWAMRNFLNLFSWRHVEAIMAQNLASQLGAAFLIWPVKQRTKALKLWLAEDKPVPIYLSHPIAGPRIERNQQGAWPDFANQVNQLQDIFHGEKITLAMPAGIDELRFQTSGDQYTGRLEARWPLPTDNDADVLYSKPSTAADYDYTSVLLPKFWDQNQHRLASLPEANWTVRLKNEINAFFQVLVGEIESQICSRDFLFIYHTRGLVVYRPYYSISPRPDFSGGVRAEVDLWEDIAQLGGESRIAFLHFESDVPGVLSSIGPQIIQCHLASTIRSLFQAMNISLQTETVEAILANRGDITEVHNVLDRENISQKDKATITNEFPNILTSAKKIVLKKCLSGALVDVKEQLIGVWVLKDFDEVKSAAPAVAAFLRNGHPNGNGWTNRLESLFPDSCVYPATEVTR